MSGVEVDDEGGVVAEASRRLLHRRRPHSWRRSGGGDHRAVDEGLVRRKLLALVSTGVVLFAVQVAEGVAPPFACSHQPGGGVRRKPVRLIVEAGQPRLVSPRKTGHAAGLSDRADRVHNTLCVRDHVRDAWADEKGSSAETWRQASARKRRQPRREWRRRADGRRGQGVAAG
jgi:hypothetical protein